MFSEFKKPSKFRAVQIYSFRGIGNLNFIFSPVLKSGTMKPKYKSDKSILLSVFLYPKPPLILFILVSNLVSSQVER